MQQGSGFLLVVLGLLAIWVVVSGKFDLMESFFYQLFDIPLPENTIDKNKAQIKSGVTGEKTAPVSQADIEDILHETGVTQYTPPFVAGDGFYWPN